MGYNDFLNFDADKNKPALILPDELKDNLFHADVENNSYLYNMKCEEGMKEFPSRYFDLGIVDPPYGIGFSEYQRGGYGEAIRNRYIKNGKKKWDDSIPSHSYFAELFRVCKNVIIWGGNYFFLPPTKCFIFWYKRNPVHTFADGEYAWTSFDEPAKCFDFQYYSKLKGSAFDDEVRIHPTQKPIELYQRCIEEFDMKGKRLLDTHLGSGSFRIAATRLKCPFVAFEADREFCQKSTDRYKIQSQKQSLF